MEGPPNSELIVDPVKAFEMARVMNLARDQATDYSNYLESPEAYTAKERIAFATLRGFGLEPGDLEIQGERTANLVGEIYDVDKRIEDLEQTGDRRGLLKEAVVNSAKVVYLEIKGMVYETPKAVWRFLKAKSPSEFGGWLIDEENAKSLRQVTTASFGMCASVEALFKLNKKSPRKTTLTKFLDSWELAPEDESEETEKIAVPDFEYEETSISDTGQEVVEKIFDWTAGRYREYLKDKDEKQKPAGWGTIFEQLNSKQVEPEAIAKEGSKLMKWLNSMAEWQKRVNELDPAESEAERELNFADFLLRLTEEKEGTTLDRTRELATPIIKMFLASKAKK